MRLAEIANRNEKKNGVETAKQKAAYTKSVQAWYKMLKADAEEKKSRQRFIQAAQAFSRSFHS